MPTTAPPAFEGPLHTSNSSAITTLRSVLDRHGFTSTAVGDAMGAAVGKSHVRDDLPLYLRRLEAPTPLNTLIKLFSLDRSVDESRAAQAVAPLDLDDLREMGLIEDGPRGIRARLRLAYHDGLVLAHDAIDEERRSLRTDHVLAVNPTTVALSNLTVRRQVKRALEIGTGCGVLALGAARHADHVVGTDTNPRALNLAVFNAAINGVTNVEWRLGSLFEAVEGERFDLLFCNPPYVISPDSQYTFRDAGRRGDAICEEIIRRAPAHLNDGGFATFLINWVIQSGDDWAAPLNRWVAENSCDSWFMLSAAQDPTTYAALWNRSRDGEAYAAGVDRWVRYFEELGINLIGLGAVVLRRRNGPGWVRADHLPDSITAPASHHIERLFEAGDRLAALSSDQGLLTECFRAAADHRLQQRLKIEDGRYAVEAAEVRLIEGLPFNGSVDAYAIQLLQRCDGRRTIGEIAQSIAADAGIDAAAFTAACPAIVRRLAASGFLV